MTNEIITAMAACSDHSSAALPRLRATWVTQRTQSKRELIGAETSKRETIYGEFINQCSTRLVDAFENTLEKPKTLLPIYALLNRIRLCASDAVLCEAERALAAIAEQYFSPNLSLEQMRTLVRDGATTDPLRPFAEACRAELKSIRSALGIRLLPDLTTAECLFSTMANISATGLVFLPANDSNRGALLARG
jgi:hypothetical protein